jgi:NAD(P)-dependent dehydrogenase (short-subunit alcohol dehydrogenase family)
MNTQHRTAIVTGASSGIGLAIARMLLARGWNVVGNARTAERLADAGGVLMHSDHFLGVAGNIAQPATARRLVEAATERFGSVDLLINNAGAFLPKPFVDFTEAEIELQVATMLYGTIFASQEAARQMMARGRGQIINITASVALQPRCNVTAFLAVLLKGGINAATRALALELAPHNIRVNAVAPGIVDTPMHTPESHAFLRTLQPVGRLGTVDEVAEAVRFLIDTEFVNGIVLAVDGGASAGCC